MPRTKPKGTDNDVHLITQDKADIIQDQQRQTSNRITVQPSVDSEPSIPHKAFRNFSARHQNGVV